MKPSPTFSFAALTPRWARWGAVCLVAAIGLLGRAATPARAQTVPSSAGYQLIVHGRHSTTQIDRSFVAQAFLKKIRKWPDGAAIQPVDLEPGSSVRHRYSVDVLGRSIDAVRSYWQQMIFSGRELPPAELPGDEEVVSFVARTPGAIGYVSPAVPLKGVKVLAVR
jgi:ABC-type phosphate transport system substrate-binding protein